ncbi:MAG TPA: metallophosphoesterase family protein [Burkholderiales bacterium]|nr:metallophosphoesterase family protein [Burkholderiales bacterium]
MRTIVHMSDLHFGRVDRALIEPLRRRVHALAPHVTVVSGDLTQRAKPDQFREARRFLDSLPGARIVVPGNHDVPLYNLFQRFFTPLSKYQRFISDDLEPTYRDEEMVVVGINTARSLVFKGGRVNEEQVEAVRAKLCALPESIAKVVVSHHPFDLPEHMDDDDIVGHANRAMHMFSRCGADVLLAGHVHVSHAGDTTERYKIDGYAALVVQAGTATSTRGRGEANSFNALRVSPDEVTVDRYSWREGVGEFELSTSETFRRSGEGWSRNPPPSRPSP